MTPDRLAADIRDAVRSLFGEPARLDRPGIMERYVAVAEGATGEHIREAFGRCADKSPYLPTPAVFAGVLAMVRQDAGDVRSAQDIPERSETCPVCGALLRFFQAEDRWVPFGNNGGLMFREFKGEWLAMRCWECRGPAHLRATLPVPHVTQMAHYVPASYTPLEALRAAGAAAMRTRLTHGGDWAPIGELCATAVEWEANAVANTQQRIAQQQRAEAAQAVERPRYAD